VKWQTHQDSGQAKLELFLQVAPAPPLGIYSLGPFSLVGDEIAGYIIKRLISLIPVLFGVSLAVFLLMHLIPGDPVSMMVLPGTPFEVMEAMRHQLGLDKPIHVQYFMWLGKVLRGDLGRSITTNTPVLKELVNPYLSTLQLALVSITFAIGLGLITGIISATKQYSFLDSFCRVFAIFTVAAPGFWIGLLLMLLFSVKLGWLPTTGKGGLDHFILPAIALGAASTAIISRMTRASMLEVLEQDYVRTARSKGCPRSVVIWKHALKNSLIPIITVGGLQFGYLIGGAVITETVFAWPGIGQQIIISVNFRDFPMVQGAVLMIATSFVIVNLLTDLLYAFVDPRIRYG